MRVVVIRFVVGVLAGLGLSVGASASPQLQLGIYGGIYDVGTETIVTSADSFTVVALAHVADTPLAEKHFLSIAVSPRQDETPVPNFGSFLLNGNVVNVVADMTYGNPPIGAVNPLLGSHDIYDTYFLEFEFFFDSGNTAADINTEDSPSTALNTSGSFLYFKEFDLDVSNLSADIELHFDLYNTAVKNNGNITRGDFAPFSHDAATVPPLTPPGDPQDPLPEIASFFTWALLGLSISGVRHRREQVA